MKAFFEVHLRLVITVWVILMSVLSLLYLMNYMKFDSLMSNVVSSKLEVISSSLETSIKRVERLGIPFQSADNLVEQFDKARRHEPNVLAISLIDQKGDVLFKSADEAKATAEIPKDVVRRALKSNEAKWIYSDDTRLYSGLQIYGGFGSLAGSIVIEYDKSALFGIYALVRLHLLEATVVIFLISALLVSIIIRAGFGDVANVIKLIQGYSSGKKNLLEQPPNGVMTQNFAEQLKQSEEMKQQVSHELERIQNLSKDTSKQAEAVK